MRCKAFLRLMANGKNPFKVKLNIKKKRRPKPGGALKM